MFKVVDLEKGTVINQTLEVVNERIKELEAQVENARELAAALQDAQTETAEAKIERIAKACHEANRAYCASMGDLSQAPWDLAPDWQRQSAIAGVQAVIDDPWVTPGHLHAAWMAQKQANGWVYGEVKDPEAKTHPCMVPYDELPPEQRAKDHIFGAIVRALMS